MEDRNLRQALENVFGVNTYLYRDRNKDFLFMEKKPCNGNGRQMAQHRSKMYAALDYEEMGYSVIPMRAEIVSPTEIKKIALVKWKEYQTIRPTRKQIMQWWLQWPNALIGVICGKVSGIIAVDTDTPEGDEEFQSLLPEGLEIPICKSPRGGKHYIFKYEFGIANINSPHFEVKSDGAIIILPPSSLSDGRGYEWLMR